MIAVQCQCGVEFELPNEWGGRQGKCPSCSQVLNIPAAERHDGDSRAPTEAQKETQAASRVVRESAKPEERKGTQDELASATMEYDAAVPIPRRPINAVDDVEPPPIARAPSPQIKTSNRPATEGAVPVEDDTGRLGPISWIKNWNRLYLAAAAGAVSLLFVLIAGYSLTTSTAPEDQHAEVAQTPAPPEVLAAERQPVNLPDRAPANTTLHETTDSAPRREAPRAVPGPRRTPDRDDTTSPSGGGQGKPFADTSANGNTKVERTAAKPSGDRSLTAGSPKYDDLHCYRIQTQHAIRIPPSATILEVDGLTVPVDNIKVLRRSPSPYLFLPKGTHFVRFRPDELAVEIRIAGHVREVYDDMRSFFGIPGSVRVSELLVRGARAFDAHRQPFLLNLHGAFYVSKQQDQAAERKFQRAIRVNPTFSPAHLNLAELMLRRGELRAAARQIELAEAFNVGNVFGLSSAIHQLREQHKGVGSTEKSVAFSARDYLPGHQLSTEDKRMIALMEAMAKYAVLEEERAKILNNLAVHFTDTGHSEWALHQFRGALLELRGGGPSRFEIARKVLANMKTACRRGDLREAEEYERMYELIAP